jgi:hypothetical protein
VALQSGNFIISTGVLVTLLVALGVGWFLVTDSKRISQENQKLISDFFSTYNKTIVPVFVRMDTQSGQLNSLINLAIDNQHLILANLNQSAMNGNTTIAVFHAMLEKEISQGNRTLQNQEYFKNFTTNTTRDLNKLLEHFSIPR